MSCTIDVLIEINNQGITQVTSSDGNLIELKRNLEAVGIDTSIFRNFFKMGWEMIKDYSIIIEEYKISPGELLVVGDRYVQDIAPAVNQKARVIWVPEKDSRKSNRGLLRVLDYLDKSVL